VASLRPPSRSSRQIRTTSNASLSTGTTAMLPVRPIPNTHRSISGTNGGTGQRSSPHRLSRSLTRTRFGSDLKPSGFRAITFPGSGRTRAALSPSC
jgi:hypothetical protein